MKLFSPEHEMLVKMYRRIDEREKIRIPRGSLYDIVRKTPPVTVSDTNGAEIMRAIGKTPETETSLYIEANHAVSVEFAENLLGLSATQADFVQAIAPENGGCLTVQSCRGIRAKLRERVTALLRMIQILEEYGEELFWK